MLSHIFVRGYGHCIGEVEASSFLKHGDPDTPFFLVDEDMFADAPALLAKNQITVTFRIFDFRVEAMCLCSEEKKLVILMFSHEGINAVVLNKGKQMPVVQPCTLEVLLIQGVPERVHKVQARTYGGTGTGYIAGVLWYLWFKQYNM